MAISLSDCGISSTATTNGTGDYWYTDTSGNMIVSSDNTQNQEYDNSNIFKQVSSLLGIKIINVSITNSKVILCGKRGKKKYLIEIDPNCITVKNDKNEIIVTIPIYFSTTYSYNVPLQPAMDSFKSAVSEIYDIINVNATTAGV